MKHKANILKFLRATKLIVGFIVMTTTNAFANCTAYTTDQNWSDVGDTLIRSDKYLNGKAYLPVKLETNKSTYMICNKTCLNHAVVALKYIVQIGWPEKYQVTHPESIAKNQPQLHAQGSAHQTVTQYNNQFGVFYPGLSLGQTQEHFICKKNNGVFMWTTLPTLGASGHTVPKNAQRVAFSKKNNIYSTEGNYCDYVIIPDLSVFDEYDYMRLTSGKCEQDAGVFSKEPVASSSNMTQTSIEQNSANTNTGTSEVNNSANDMEDTSLDVASSAVSSNSNVSSNVASGNNQTDSVTESTVDCNTKDGCNPNCVTGAQSVKFAGRYCIAETCKSNYYKVKKSNVYQGWCQYISCPADQEPNIDAQDMWDQTKDKCRAKQTATVVTEQAEVVEEPTEESVEVSAPVTVAESTPDLEPIVTGPVDGADCKDTMYMADTATYQDGKCIIDKCYAGYELTGNQCIQISGPCDVLPENATRGNRQYDEETESIKCIITDCVDGYVVADDKQSCHEDYDALADVAREREQSFGNKLLGAVGMGATGIGGSMLMSGLAESASDDEAEIAMKAYLSTFTCKYGNASVTGGTKNVEVPGGNELIQMYADYVSLANDLKVRKEALGMQPGIESEPILDSATSGLYDDVSTGKTKGAYASLARALSDPDSEDAKIWATQREESDEKKKTGANTAGVGAGVSLIGNAISEGADKNKK